MNDKLRLLLRYWRTGNNWDRTSLQLPTCPFLSNPFQLSLTFAVISSTPPPAYNQWTGRAGLTNTLRRPKSVLPLPACNHRALRLPVEAVYPYSLPAFHTRRRPATDKDYEIFRELTLSLIAQNHNLAYQYVGLFFGQYIL